MTVAETRPAVPVDGDAGQPIPAPLGHAVVSVWRALRSLAWRSASLLLVFLLWEMLPRIGIVNPIWFPPFSTVVGVFRDMVVSGELRNHLGGSLTRSMAGFSLAVLLAVPLGLVIGWYPRLGSFFSSALEFFRNTSALALLPVFILFLGIGETSKIAIVLFSCFFPILLNTISGVTSVDPLLVKSARSLSFSSFAIFRKVILPYSVPSIFTGFRLAAENSILVLIAAEMVGATRGLGFLIVSSQLNFMIAKMYAGILTIALVGLVLNYGLVLIERRLSYWRLQGPQLR